ncbi:MAG: AAA family ATPase, partial [Clostridia bacterium]
MITNLEIKNIALISYLSIDFNIGLTVMSGETGSGKSIIVDSLAFVLGERADKTMIKYGEEQAQVQVVFSVDVDSNAYRVMSELGFESDTTIIFSRTLTMSGKNECRINGKICSTSMLKQVASCLVDIFGQSQHLNLLKVDNHIGVLDGFVPCLELKGRLAYLYSEYRKIKKSLAEFGGSEAERDRMLDILKYQIDEIKEADLSVNEENELQATHIKVVNTEKIVTSLQNSLAFLSESESNALSCVSESASSLSNICDLDSKIKDCHKRLYASNIELEDISETLNDLLSSMDYDMREVDRMEERLEKIKNTKRKYGGSVDKALEFLDNAERQYNNLFDATAQIEKLNKEKSDIVKQMYAESEKL